MLLNSRLLEGCMIESKDRESNNGELHRVEPHKVEPIGRVCQFLFDDDHWKVRYVVVQMGGRLAAKKVLLAPHAITRALVENHLLRVNLTRKEVEDSPDIDTDMPLSRQKEIEFHNYYRWPFYWVGADVWGLGSHPWAIPLGYEDSQPLGWPNVPQNLEQNSDGVHAEAQKKANPHLRSTAEIHGYSVRAIDQEFGRVESIIFDESSWEVRYFVVEKSWWNRAPILIECAYINEIDWDNRCLCVSLTKYEILSGERGGHLNLESRAS